MTRGFIVYRESNDYDFLATDIDFTGIDRGIGSGYFVVPDLYNDFTNGAGLDYHSLQEDEIYIKDRVGVVRFRGLIMDVTAVTEGVRFDIAESTILFTQRHCKAEYPFDKGTITAADNTSGGRLQDNTKNWSTDQWVNHGVLSYPSPQKITPYRFITSTNHAPIINTASHPDYMGRGFGEKDDLTGTYTIPVAQESLQENIFYFAVNPHNVDSQLAVLADEAKNASEQDCLRIKWHNASSAGSTGNRALVDVIFEVGELPTSDILGMNIKIQAAMRHISNPTASVYIFNNGGATDGSGTWEDLSLNVGEYITVEDPSLDGIFQIWEHTFELELTGGDFQPLDDNDWDNYVWDYKKKNSVGGYDDTTTKVIRLCIETNGETRVNGYGMQVGQMVIQLIREGTDTNQYKIIGVTAPVSLFFASDPSTYIGKGDRYAICPSLMTIINDMTNATWGVTDYPFAIDATGLSGAADHFLATNFLDQKHLSLLATLVEYKNLTWWFDPTYTNYPTTPKVRGKVYIDEQIDVPWGGVSLDESDWEPGAAYLNYPQANILGKVTIRGNKSMDLIYTTEDTTNSTQEYVVSRPWITNYQELKTYGDNLLSRWKDRLPSFKVRLDYESIGSNHLLRPGKLVRITYKNLVNEDIPINRIHIQWVEGKKPIMYLEAGKMGTPPWEKTEDKINQIWGRVRRLESGDYLKDHEDNLLRRLHTSTRGAGSDSWIFPDPAGGSGIIGLIDGGQTFNDIGLSGNTHIDELEFQTVGGGDPVTMNATGTIGNEVVVLDKGGLTIPGDYDGTWGGDNIGDGYIPASAVTQHQAVLTVKGSLLTDTVPINRMHVDFPAKGSLLTDNVPNNRIPSSAVTQHEASITHNNLGGVSVNEHIDWTNTTESISTSGSISGSNLTAGGGASVETDAIQIVDGAATWLLEATSEDANFSVISTTAGDRLFYMKHNNYPTKRINFEMDGYIKSEDIAEIGSDTDKFLMSDGGVIKYVTGANLLAYTGGNDNLGDHNATQDLYMNSYQIEEITDLNLNDGGTSFNIQSYTNATTTLFLRNVYTAQVMNVAIDGQLTVSNIPAGNADYNAFVASHGGILKTRTGDELLSDIGGVSGNHHISHEDGGGDEINVGGLNGVLAEAQTPASHSNTAHSTNYEPEVTWGIALGNGVKISTACTVADIPTFSATGLEGLSYSEFITTLGLAETSDLHPEDHNNDHHTTNYATASALTSHTGAANPHSGSQATLTFGIALNNVCKITTAPTMADVAIYSGTGLEGISPANFISGNSIAVTSDLHAQNHDNTYHTTNYATATGLSDHIADSGNPHSVVFSDISTATANLVMADFDITGLDHLDYTATTACYIRVNHTADSMLYIQNINASYDMNVDIDGSLDVHGGIDLDSGTNLTWNDQSDYGIFEDSGTNHMRIAARGSLIMNIDSNNNDTSSYFGVVKNENDFSPAAYIMACTDSGFRLSNTVYVTSILQSMTAGSDTYLATQKAIKDYVDKRLLTEESSYIHKIAANTASVWSTGVANGAAGTYNTATGSANMFFSMSPPEWMIKHAADTSKTITVTTITVNWNNFVSDDYITRMRIYHGLGAGTTETTLIDDSTDYGVGATGYTSTVYNITDKIMVAGDWLSYTLEVQQGTAYSCRIRSFDITYTVT